MYSDQVRKYGISVSMIQALYYDIVVNKVIIMACIMDPEMPYFFINFSHYTSSAWYIMRYIVYPGLVSCPFYAIRIIIPLLIYEVCSDLMLYNQHPHTRMTHVCGIISVYCNHPKFTLAPRSATSFITNLYHVLFHVYHVSLSF